VSGLALGPLNLIAEAGFLGVDLFFFISGFCLFLPYARAAVTGRPAASTTHFFMRRAQKIVPSYLLALGVFAIVYHDRFASPGDAAVQLASHLAFVHTLAPATFYAISGPLWTIGIEVQFYLLFPLIAPWFVRRPWLAYGALVAAAETYRIAVALSGNGSSVWMTNEVPAFFDLFGAGMLTAWLLAQPRTSAENGGRTATLASLAAFAAAIAVLAVTTLIGRATGSDGMRAWVNDYRLVFGPLCIALALTSIRAGEGWRRVVTAKPLVWLSAISYNVYLWHLEITVWFHNAGLASVPAMLLAVASSLAVAALLTYRLERPILALDLSPGAARGSPSFETSSPSRRAA
jgi:peptidoglycan/LPS O-acetylase OafA/YrhL